MATAGFAQSLFESESESANSSDEKNAGFSLNGYMKSSVYGGGKEYNLATTFAELVLQGKLNYKNAFLQSDIRLREGLFFNSHEQQYELTELYGGYRSEKFDLLLGNQIVLYDKGIKTLMVEGGSTLNFSLLKEGLIDEIRVCVAPMVVGGIEAKSLFGGDGFDTMDEAVKLELFDYFSLGKDLILQYKVVN